MENGRYPSPPIISAQATQPSSHKQRSAAPATQAQSHPLDNEQKYRYLHPLAQYELDGWQEIYLLSQAPSPSGFYANQIAGNLAIIEA